MSGPPALGRQARVLHHVTNYQRRHAGERSLGPSFSPTLTLTLRARREADGTC